MRVGDFKSKRSVGTGQAQADLFGQVLQKEDQQQAQDDSSGCWKSHGNVETSNRTDQVPVSSDGGRENASVSWPSTSW